MGLIIGQKVKHTVYPNTVIINCACYYPFCILVISHNYECKRTGLNWKNEINVHSVAVVIIIYKGIWRKYSTCNIYSLFVENINFVFLPYTLYLFGLRCKKDNFSMCCW